MVQVVGNVEVGKERVAPWWERSKTYRKMWRGTLFDRMLLKGDDEEEQRIQSLREAAIFNTESKRGSHF
jgi:hypothetical protein